MSIETLLTLGLAVAILAIAAVLRFVILGLIRLGLRLSGRQVPWLQKGAGGTSRARGAAQRRPLRPRIARAGRSGLEAASFLASGFVEGLTIAVLGIVRGIAVVAAVTRPRLSDARRGVTGAAASATGSLRPRVAIAAGRIAGVARSAAVVAIATVQHVGRVIAQQVRLWIDERQEERSRRPGEATAEGDGPRVIDLNREFDPLTDDFPEDRVGSSV